MLSRLSPSSSMAQLRKLVGPQLSPLEYRLVQKALPALAAALRDSDSEVRYYAVIGLARSRTSLLGGP